jgi:hypothetical protein
MPQSRQELGKRRASKAAALALAAGAALGIIAVSAGAMAGTPKHVFLIMMENHSTEDIFGNKADAPYINQLIAEPGVLYATQYFGVTHPSLPNYLALISGSTQGIWDDCKAGADVTCKPEEFVPDSEDPATAGQLLTDRQMTEAENKPHLFKGKTLVDQLEAAGLSWKAYMEAMPADRKDIEYAPVGADGKVIAKLYAQKHNPFMYFADVRNNPQRLAKVVPYDELAQDLSAGKAADFVWISPHQCHDMHGVSPAGAKAVQMPDCGYPDSGLDHGAIELGDTYLHDTVAEITGSPAWKEGAVLLIVWDEDDYAGFSGTGGSPVGRNGTLLGGSRAPLIIVTAGQGPARKLDAPANHYSLLAAIEAEWHLGCLGESCKAGKANALAGLIQ